MRYVTLPDVGDDGLPLVERWPSADRDEFGPTVNEWDDELVPVLIDEVVVVTETTVTKDGSTTTKTYQQATGRKIPDPSGATVPSGRQVERIVDPGGELRVFKADRLLKEYPAGGWKSCSEDPPEWYVEQQAGDS